MSSTLEFLNFMKANWAVGPEGASSTVQVDPDAEKKAQAMLDRTEAKIPAAEQAAEGRKAKYLKDKAGTDSFARFATETGLGAATQQRTEGTAASQSQGPVQSSPGGVGTGKASAFARQKGAQAPRLQGKVPSMSTQVRSQNRLQKPPAQQMPVGQKMLKTFSLDKFLKAVDDMEKDMDDNGYNTKGERRETKRRKDRKMKVTGKGVQNLQQILVDRAKRLEEKE